METVYFVKNNPLYLCIYYTWRDNLNRLTRLHRVPLRKVLIKLQDVVQLEKEWWLKSPGKHQEPKKLETQPSRVFSHSPRTRILNLYHMQDQSQLQGSLGKCFQGIFYTPSSIRQVRSCSRLNQVSYNSVKLPLYIHPQTQRRSKFWVLQGVSNPTKHLIIHQLVHPVLLLAKVQHQNSRCP